MSKTLPLLVSLLFISGLAVAQKISEKEIPEAVKNAFHQQYPKADDIKWDKEDANYEVSFEEEEGEKETDRSVVYDATGNVLETEVEIEAAGLPQSVRDYVQVNYDGKKIKEAAKISDAGNTLTYEAEIKGKDLIFDSNGKFIREEKD